MVQWLALCLNDLGLTQWEPNANENRCPVREMSENRPGTTDSAAVKAVGKQGTEPQSRPAC